MLATRKKRAAGKGEAQQPVSRPATIEAPEAGLVEIAASGSGCLVAENVFKTDRGYRVRGGKYVVADCADPVVDLIRYLSGQTERLFATTATDIYDISALDPEASLAPAVTGRTGGYYGSAQLGNVGGEYLLAANGEDSILLYDGIAWYPIADSDVHTLDYDGGTGDFALGETVTGGTSSATAVVRGITGDTASGTLIIDTIAGGPFQDDETLTGGVAGAAVADGADAIAYNSIDGVATADLNYVWTHKNRFWFVEKSSQTAWYLAVDAIGGTATAFQLSGVFQRGGTLLFGATWSSDSGSGMDDRQVFVSSIGEVAVYQGTDPSDPDAWALVGVYNMATPLGASAHTRNGGDVLIATGDGLVGLSAVTTAAPEQLGQTSLARNIEPTWRRRFRGAVTPWEVVKWAEEGMLAVSQPDTRSNLLVANVNTGAWTEYSGWDVQCLGLFGRGMFFGSADGKVYQAERGGSDDGSPYVCRVGLLPNDFGEPGIWKDVGMIQAVYSGARDASYRISIASDYSRDFPPAPPAVSIVAPGDALFDTGVWDTAKWDVIGDEVLNPPVNITRWVSVSGQGQTLGPQIQFASNGDVRPDAEFLAFNLMYGSGAMVV